MRFLSLFTAAALCACGQTLPPLVDVQNSAEWITKTQLSAVQVDAAGDVYFAGVVPTGNTVPATHTLGPGGDYDIVVFKMDARLEQLRYLTVIGGTGTDTLSSLQVDGEGHAFLAGRASASPDFPVTKQLPGITNDSGGFVLRLSTAGDKIEYSVLMPMEARLLALGNDGGIYVSGSALPGQVPVTPAAFLTQPPDDYSSNGYVIKFRAGDGELEFATWLQQRLLNSMAARQGGGVALAADDVLVGFNSAGSNADFTTTLESMFNRMAADAAGNFYVHTAASAGTRLSKYSPQGVRIWATDFGQGLLSETITVSEDGTTYMSGIFPANFRTRNSLEACLPNRSPFPFGGSVPGIGLLMVSGTGSVVYSGFTSVRFQSTIVAGGGRYLYGPASLVASPLIPQAVFRLDSRQIPAAARLSPACLANGASYNAGSVTPGEIMTIYGSGIGPEAGVSFGLVDGRVPAELAGVNVTVDGIPAPILYAQDAQINFIVPWSTRPFGSVPVCVRRESEQVCFASQAAALDVAMFGDAQGPLVLLSDWTRTNRVPSGGYITLFVTGTGRMDGAVEDGGVSGHPLVRVVAEGRATMSDPVPVCAPMGNCRVLPDAQIVYSGNSPGLVWGLTQINVKLPDLGTGTFRLTLSFPGSRTSPSVDLQLYRP